MPSAEWARTRPIIEWYAGENHSGAMARSGAPVITTCRQLGDK